ncbi:MAG: hydratase, partial [Pseudomonadota bacterium]
MTPAAKAAAELLRRRRNDEQGGRLDQSIRPTSIDDALAIQAEYIKQHRDSVGGWKCLLPADNGNIIVAPIFSQEIQMGQTCCLAATNGLAMIEPEMAFVLGEDMPAKTNGYSSEQVDQAIARCHMALELTKPRFAPGSEFDYYEMFADCFINQGMFIGPEIDKNAAYHASEVRVTIGCEGEIQQLDGKHPNLNTYKPVHWLVHTMSQRGVSFKKGQAIITGSYAGLVALEFNR